LADRQSDRHRPEQATQKGEGVTSAKLDGRRLIVTGASSGIGKALALVAAGHGARVACVARSLSRLQQVAADARGVAVAIDVSDRAAVLKGVGEAVEALEGLDGLINCAGLMLHSRLSLGTYEDWRQMVDVNLLGPMLMSHAAIPYLRENGSGDIVNVSSTAKRQVTRPEYALYSATKSGLAMVSSGLRQELAEDHIRVSLVTPGLVRETGFGPDIRDDCLREEIMSMKDVRGIAPDLVAEQVCHVLALPPEACIDEIVIVPLWQVNSIHPG
jgi:NADP-dependent 3-hydroxy acid dehydrogenase YdfG